MRRSSNLPKDSNQRALAVVNLSVEEPKQTASVKEYLASIGRKGGLKGGKSRAQKLSKEKRSEIASNAAKARWTKQRSSD
jgi:hypothetical protein